MDGVQLRWVSDGLRVRKLPTAAIAVATLAVATGLVSPTLASARDHRGSAARGQARPAARRGGVLKVGDPPALLTTGKRFSVRFTASKAPVFLLSHDGRRGRGDLALSGHVSQHHGKGSATLLVPRSATAGRWLLLACTAEQHGRCTVSHKAGVILPAKLPAPHGSGSTGADLIENAQAAGKLPAATALLYRVYAAYGSKALPKQYRGNVGGLELGEDALQEAAAKWGRLPASVKAKLKPYFIPPRYRGSALATTSKKRRAAGKRRRAAGKRTAKTAAAPPAATAWRSVAAKHVRVWWDPSSSAASQDAADASAVLSEVEETIWPKLTDIMQREPISDAHVASNGGDGKLDIYIRPFTLTSAQAAAAGVQTAAETVPYSESCNKGPRWVWIYDIALQPAVIAHEFFHTLTAAYDQIACQENAFWDEGTANWAGNLVEPHYRPIEQNASEYLGGVDDGGYRSSLERHSYTSWLFAQFLADKAGPDAIRQTWAKAGSEHILDAIDAAAAPAGGLNKLWPEFELANANQGPDGNSDGGYWEKELGLDGSSVLEAETTNSSAAWSTLKPDGVPVPLKMYAGTPASLLHLSGRVFWYKVGPGVRTVTFLDNGPFADGSDPAANVQAIVSVAGQPDQDEDWTGKQGAAFCLARPSEQITGLILIFSDSSTSENFDWSTPPEIAATDMGCSQWTGTINGKWEDGTGMVETTQASVTFTDPSPSGIGILAGGYTGTGTVTWTLSGSQDECTYSGQDSWTVQDNTIAVNPPLKLGWDDALAGNWTGYEGVLSPQFNPITVTAACPEETQQVPWVDHMPTWTTEAPLTAPPQLSSDGLTMDGQATEKNENTFEGTATWSWHLTSTG